MQGSIFKVQAHRRALHLVDGRGVDHALVGSNQEESEAARGSATATTSRGSIPGAIGVDGSYEPIAPNLNRIDPLRSLSQFQDRSDLAGGSTRSVCRPTISIDDRSSAPITLSLSFLAASASQKDSHKPMRRIRLIYF
jgi:hypothetical protein